MVAIIVGTHGSFSKQILRSAEMIFGMQENVSSVTFETGEGLDDLVEKYKNESEKLDCKDGVLFLVDLFGGSPFNAASRIVTENDNMDVLTGINLPMLLEIYGSRGFSNLEELVSIGKRAGAEGIKSLREVFSETEDDEELL
ncbi:mannose/fructose/sorbose PTS transporter subunit IIA [Clostridium estertheticum]|uniref:PTS mannose transporter subunit IID n=2 Tax=Clostridium estertheticum TaxID=238834 RepID=A0A1J0GDH5_9CLOT|nr:mannose/fructose/sorbose PTS transporter subunit IIA [Clostridium estertheticum]APC39410.1 PTS mannose transporter subunit IID [Clostridium estertheticum subsp. estertheticum]MBU3072083.1 mannose/fructose/sorbose PTS transporter subunit IIA [Clostridium estertheticum]MBU3162175.1 mannose/fructose/sorbose PTS transporter subunit IIA [Clostridium estertheticum]MBU3170606.1 mannose/fructose/sorbose PTS transporter subunit IIA [Clostridium estertheticum]MBU3184759.1 mannose/fructose/sorbose PTS